MQLSLIGINHKTAPVEIRERVALSADVEIALARLREFVTHGVILSTCNRTRNLRHGERITRRSHQFPRGSAWVGH